MWHNRLNDEEEATLVAYVLVTDYESEYLFHNHALIGGSLAWFLFNSNRVFRSKVHRGNKVMKLSAVEVCSQTSDDPSI